MHSKVIEWFNLKKKKVFFLNRYYVTRIAKVHLNVWSNGGADGRLRSPFIPTNKAISCEKLAVN